MFEISLKIDRDHEVWKMLASNKNPLLTSGHIGTHVDVYNKTEVPKEYLDCDGVLIDCTKYELGSEIGVEAIKGVHVKKKDFVIFKTGIQKENPYGSINYLKNHYELSWELIDFLLEKEVSFIGIDCAGIRRGEEHYRADVRCENQKTYVVENLSSESLDEIEFNRFKVFTVWIDNPIATGLSTKIFVYGDR